MEYFNSEMVKTLHDCKNDRFVAYVGDNKHVLIDKIGRVVSDGYYEIKPRKGGFFVAKKSSWSDAETLLTSDGKEILVGAKKIHSFSDDGVALVEKPDGSKVWFSKEGSLFGGEFADIGTFSGGFGCVMRDDGKWTYVDRQFEMSENAYDIVTPFLGDYAYVIDSGKCFVIDKSLKVLSGPYDKILFIDSENKLVAAQKRNPETNETSYCYFSVDGKQIGGDYHMIHGFVNGRSRVLKKVPSKTQNGKTETLTYFIDLQGNEISSTGFSMAGNFGKNVTYAGGVDSETGDFSFTIMFKNGMISNEWYPYVGEEVDGMIPIMKGSSSYYYDVQKGKTVSKGFKRLSGVSEGVAHFESSKDKYKFLDIENRDFRVFGEGFDVVHNFSGGYGVVKNGENYDAIRKNEIALSQISSWAQAIEQTPIVVLNLPEELLRDTEIAYLLSCHAIEVLDFALQSETFDDISKAQFQSDKKMIEVLKLKLASSLPQKTFDSEEDFYEFNF